MTNDKKQPQPTSELPDDVVDAWAAVLIDVYEKRKQEAHAASPKGAEQTTATESEEDGDDAQSP